MARTIYESHRETRENFTGRLTTGVMVRAPYDDFITVEEGPALIERYQPNGFSLDLPGHGLDQPGVGLDSTPTFLDVQVIPNQNGEFIERFRDDWFKPDTLPSGVIWDTVNNELRW